MSVTIAAHRARVLALAHPATPVDTPLAELPGRVLAADAPARFPIPPFDNSAMDGFLVRRADLTGEGPWTLPVAGDVPAGSAPLPVPVGHAVRIMTGAPTGDPSGLAVIPVEDTNIPSGPHPLPESVTVFRLGERSHIRRAGDSLQPGHPAATAGTPADAPTLAALVSAGVASVSAYPAPAVAVVTSGSELLTATDAAALSSLPAGALPNSNGPMLAELARVAGASEVTHRHVVDSPEALAAELDSLAAAGVDLIITSGGVSAGAFDVVHEVLGASPDAWFGEVCQKPGAPQGASTWRGVPVLSFPGNPVAAFVSFHLYGAPVLRRLRGLPDAPAPCVVAQPDTEFPRVRDRVLIVPVRLDFTVSPPRATPFSGRHVGSHLVGSLAGTHGYAVLESTLPDGASVDVYLY